MHQSFEDDPAADTSPPYTSRLRAVEVSRASAACEGPETREPLDEATGGHLVKLRDALQAGCCPDDTLPNVNAHRVAFARWLIDHGKLSEGDR